MSDLNMALWLTWILLKDRPAGAENLDRYSVFDTVRDALDMGGFEMAGRLLGFDEETLVRRLDEDWPGWRQY